MACCKAIIHNEFAGSSGRRAHVEGEILVLPVSRRRPAHRMGYPFRQVVTFVNIECVKYASEHGVPLKAS